MIKFYKKLITTREELRELEYKGVPSNMLQVLPNKLGEILFDKLPRSINLVPAGYYYTYSQLENVYDWTDIFTGGVGNEKNGSSWERRKAAWVSQNKDKDLVFAGILSNGPKEQIVFLMTPEASEFYDNYADYDKALPIFKNYGFDLSQLSTTKTETPKMLSTKLFNKVLDGNKDAAQLAAKLSVGKAANQVITGKLAKSFPWYAKLFGRHKEVVNNPLMRIGTAEAIYAAVLHMQPNNTKLQYVAEAMLQEAMVDVATNSGALKSVISELEALVGHLPDATK